MTPQDLLRHPDAIRLADNRMYLQDWDQSGGRVSVQPTGHHVCYGRHGQRILLSDPEGNPLHECVWQETSAGRWRLIAARIRLDWGQWIGMKPEGLVNSISLDLSRRQGWERVTRDDLRQMAAMSMHADLDTMRFFYRDEDVVLHGNGKASIHQIKDAFYVLPSGSFDSARFMSCMSRLTWNRIDYLPVVELFLSLLPGTGSAVFELIRGLYDDQNETGARPLQYRGIPVYPSEAAFRLFSLFFRPVSHSDRALEVFLDPARSQEILWLPAADYPVRYVDTEQRVCVTVKNHTVQKATVWDDSAGLSFTRLTDSGHPVSDNRGVASTADQLYLYDGAERRILTSRPSWQVSHTQHSCPWQPCDSTWRDCFPLGPPALTPSQAFSSVLLYPDSPGIIGEKESQPFVFDYVDDLCDGHQDLLHRRSQATQIVIIRCEAGLRSCLNFEHPQVYTMGYIWPEFAQKHAQLIWNTLFRMKRLAWLKSFRLFPVESCLPNMKNERYEWMYLWIPFSDYGDSFAIGQWGELMQRHLSRGGIGCVAGPPALEASMSRSFQILHAAEGHALPTFRIHQTILPEGRLHPDLHIWIVQRL